MGWRRTFQSDPRAPHIRDFDDCNGCQEPKWVLQPFFHLQADSSSLLVRRLPEINLDPFKFCVYETWKLGDLVFINIAIAFGTLSPSQLWNSDKSHAPLHRGPL